MPAANTTTISHLIARASSNWGCAGITVKTETCGRSRHTVIALSNAAGPGRGVELSISGDRVAVYTDARSHYVSVDAALALVEARIACYCAHSAMCQATRDAEDALRAVSADYEAA